MGINGCATGLALHKYIVEMEWLQSTGTGFLMYTNANISPATLLRIERRKKSGTKIHHGLRRPPNTNKNATTNQKHAGLMGKR
jgi:hypothetical protein